MNNTKITNLDSYIYSLDEKEKTILVNYLNGKSLKEVGLDFNLSKETISKKMKKILSGMPLVDEDKYVYFFEKYKIDKKEFMYIFNESEKVYRYLNIKYKKGKIFLKEIAQEKLLPELELERINILFKKNEYFIIKGEEVLKNKRSMVKFVIKSYKKEMNEKRLREKYIEFLDKNKLSKEEFLYSGNYFKKVILDFENILTTRGKKIRYYDFSKISEEEIVEKLNLKKYVNENMIISAELLYRKNLEYMKEINIENYYELHNFLRKKIKNPGWYNLTFNRMPNMMFGKITLEEQILNFINKEKKKFSSVKELCIEFEEKYGLNKITLGQENYKFIRQNI